MKREITLREPKTGKALTLPVTPESYQVSTEMHLETVNIHGAGDAVFAGNGGLGSFSIAALLPARLYEFSRSGTPEPYIEQLKKWCREKAKLRYIVQGTKVNLPVMLEKVAYGEQDGSNDVYAELSLREYRPLKVVQVQRATQNKKRDSEPEKAPGESLYTAVYGDTLCSICRRFYGSDSPDTYNRLAAYNGKANPNLLMTGEVLKIPQPLP